MPPAEYCRSGFHSGQSASGYFDESIGIFLGGTDRTRKTTFESLEVTERTGEAPNECVCDVRGFQPTKLQEIKIYNGGLDVGVPLFAGHLQLVEQDGKQAAQRPTFHLTATDYWWLLDRYALVTKTYRNQGVSTIVGDILYSYTDGGFNPGYLPSSLGDITEISFTQERVSAALRRLADACNGTLRLDYKKSVSILDGTNIDTTNSIDLTASGTDFWDVKYTVDPSQWRTRVIWEGGGSTATAMVAAGATTVAVDEIGWYSASGGTVRAGTVIFTYTGRDADSGPGNLTGCSSITDEIAQGASLYVMVTVDNATAQTTLAGILGGGLSGIAVQYNADNRLGLAELAARANTDLTQYLAAQETLTYTTTNPYVRPGRAVAVSLTAPYTISTTLTVQEQKLRGRHRTHNITQLALDRIVKIAPRLKTLVDRLAEAGV
jgi:hypothetical protein